METVAISIEAEQSGVRKAQLPCDVILRDHDRDRRIREDEVATLGRIRRVDRHVRRTRLQHPQHRRYEVERPLDAEADERAGLDPQLDELVGDSVRLLVEHA